jgi:hypothetical protein
MTFLSSPGTVFAVGPMEHELPEPVAMTCAVFTGIVVYVFGGATDGDLLDTIYAINPENGRTTALPYRLPSPRKLASAVWTGSEAYIIGGIGFDAEPIAEIVKFVPEDGVTVVEGAMPYGTKGVPSIWDGHYVHILGNCLSSERGQYDVIRFDPSTGNSTILEEVLPIPGAGSTAVWADDRAYIVGGRQNLTVLSDRIVEYVPGEGATFVDARLPLGRIGAGCAWDGERVHAFGGTIALVCGPLECVPIDYLDEIAVFDPVNDTCDLSERTLTEPMDVRAVVFAPNMVKNHGWVLIPGGLTAAGPVAYVTMYVTNPPEAPEPHRSGLDGLEDRLGFDPAFLVAIIALVLFILWVYFGEQFGIQRRGRNG